MRIIPILSTIFALSGFCAPLAAQAQGACSPHKITVPTLQVLGDPTRPGEYVATLHQGDVICIVAGSITGPQRLGQITQRILPGGGSETLNGWASTLFMVVTEASVNAPPPVTDTSSGAGTGTGSTTTTGAEALEDGELRFDEPIPYGPSATRGKSMAELIEGTPEFPPIEGLPETLWKKPCKTCHAWNKELLCEQGKSYIPNPEAVFRHQHPLGGPFKLALMRWSNTGCK